MNELQRRLGPRGLVVLGFPCNQFGHQVCGEGGAELGEGVLAIGKRWTGWTASGRVRQVAGHPLASLPVLVAAGIQARPGVVQGGRHPRDSLKNCLARSPCTAPDPAALLSHRRTPRTKRF
jgi:hypothetical protein